MEAGAKRASGKKQSLSQLQKGGQELDEEGAR